MRPIGYREQRVTQVAVNYAKSSEHDMIVALAHLRTAPDQKAARVVREGIKRAARVRGISLPRVAVCRDACCKPSAEVLSYGVRCNECGEWETSCACEVE